MKEQHKEDREIRQRHQAAGVSAWIARPHGAAPWQACIRNASSLPVYDVRVRFYEIKKIEAEPTNGSGWVAVQDIPAPRDETLCVFPPDADRYVPVPEDARKVFADITDRTCVVGITFTDAAGNHWERYERGMLNPRP